MHTRRTLALFFKKGRLYLRGVLRFGPARTRRARVAIGRLFDAFENAYGRLPNEQEQRRLVQKLSWFEQHYQRSPTSEEAAKMVQQLGIQ